jgi:adenylate cyclase
MWQLRQFFDEFLALFSKDGFRATMASLKSHRWSLAVSLAITVMGLLAYVYINFGGSRRSGLVFLDNVEARSLDARFQFRGPIQPAPEVVIVAIDQKTIDRIGWPFARFNYGRMLQTLSRDGAKVVGFDVDFPFPDRLARGGALSELEQEYRRTHPRGNEEFLSRLQQLEAEADSDGQFARAIKESGNVVLGHLFFTNKSQIEHMDAQRIKEYDEVLAFQAYPQVLKRVSKERYRFNLEADDAIAAEPNLRIFADAANSYGAFNFDPDNDGTIRRASLIFHYNDPNRPTIEENFYPSLDIQMARLYLGAGPQETIVWFNVNGPEVIELGSKKVVPDASGHALINFAGPAQTFPHYSFADVADGVTPKGTFKDKIVVVGATALAIGDMRQTPFAKLDYPGVEIHANVLDNILRDRFLKRGVIEQAYDLAVMLVCGLVMGLFFVTLRPLVATVLYVIAVVALVTFVYLNFSVAGRWLSLVLPFSTLSFNYLGVVSYRVLFEEKEKRKVRGAFGQYIAPGFIAQILKDPGKLKLGGEQVELTVMFSDIRSFTSISEKLTPPELVELLNEYLTVMTDLVFKHRGTLDKYIGDAVMAFWGRPFLDQMDHAALSCEAALEMIENLQELNKKFAAEGRPTLRIGIGINTGDMICGNMGSLRRFNYTVMGDHVNLGSRAEGLNKEYGTQIIITENTYEYVADKFVTRQLDLIRVKGKRQPVAIYELLGPLDQKARYAELLTEFGQGLEAYKAGQWETALSVFKAMAAKYPSDGPTKLFLKRTKDFMEAAPEGVWDGVYTMTTK